MKTKAGALFWVLIAYVLACGAGYFYLTQMAGDLLLRSFIADVIATFVVFVFSRFFRNSSFYDPYWSVIPPLFLLVWWYEHAPGASVGRYTLMSLVVWYWAIRLTWNWAKHWEGLAHEDWRYPLVRGRYPRISGLSDFFGIHFFPTVQVFLGMLPLYAATQLGTAPLRWLDWVAFVLGMGAATIQLVSDRQLHRFIATREPGQIMDRGLWGWSRHPNYFGEVLFWFSVALFGLSAYPAGWWWEIIGFVAMTAMFVFVSIPFMDKRSLERRPGYQDVMDRVSMLVPLPPKKRAG
ncbi:MAG: DUF1295 domain-containing protein [Myxococcales bacterium]|nr:DUF1295 domain-containing protein [Myxococcales bacterium]